MKKRITAINQIVKAVVSEHTVDGEDLLWEVSIPQLQAESGVSTRTFEYVINLLKGLELIRYRSMSRTSVTYQVGLKHPELEDRIWLPIKDAHPYLKKLPAQPRHISRKLRYWTSYYEMHCELFRIGLIVQFGKDLRGPEFKTFWKFNEKNLVKIGVAQKRLQTLIGKISRKPSSIKVFREFLPYVAGQIQGTLPHLVGNERFNTEIRKKKDEENDFLPYNIVYEINLFKKKNTDIRNSIVRKLGSSRSKKSKKDNNMENSQNSCGSSEVERHLPKNFETVLEEHGNLRELKQSILNDYWRARGDYFGRYRTQALKAQHGIYSNDLRRQYRRFVNGYIRICKLFDCSVDPYPIFMAIFDRFIYRRKPRSYPPSVTWLGGQQIIDWMAEFLQAYLEIHSLLDGKKENGRESEKRQFVIFKEKFEAAFQRKFDTTMLEYFGEHSGFYIDWCLYQSLREFRIGKTYYEYRTHTYVSLFAFIDAQMSHLWSCPGRINLRDIFDEDTRRRMEVWIEEHDSDVRISVERRKQLEQFFAQRKQRVETQV